MPDGCHGGRSDAVLGEDLVEVVEVAGFLVVHVFHERSEMWVRADYRWGLGGIDQDGSKLTSLVDT